jgi:hypothetical protein
MDRIMRRLSSTMTVFYKRVLPVIWLLFLLLPILTLRMVSTRSGYPLWPSFVPTLMIFIIGFVLYRKLISDLVDEVWLDGDQLLVKNRGRQALTALADVININASTVTNPRRITVMLRTDSRFGRHVTFIPASPIGLMSAFKPDPIATELIERVDAIRQERR